MASSPGTQHKNTGTTDNTADTSPGGQATPNGSRSASTTAPVQTGVPNGAPSTQSPTAVTSVSTTATPAGQPTSTTSTQSTSTPTTVRGAGSSPSRSSGVSDGSAIGATGTSSITASSSSKEGYTAGDLAGGIIGAALGAAIITFLATFLICKRRNRRRPASHNGYEGDNTQWRSYKGGVAVAEKPASRSDNDALDWQAYLPQSADDRSIQNAIKTLFDQIELHVDNYYARTAVDPDENIRADLALVDSNKLPEDVASLVSSPQTVLPVLKHLIANQLVSKITPGDNAARSLLPSRQAQAPAQLGSSAPVAERQAMQQAYSQWRLLNAYLFPRTQQDSDARRLQTVTNDLSEAFYLAFMPWQADKNEEEALKQHERSLIARATDVGTLLLSQPSAYVFDWANSVSGGRVVVMPGLLKTTDDQGRVLETPQTLLQPMVARL